MQIQKCVRVLTSMGTPSIPNYVNILMRINFKQFLKKLRHDETIFPVVESVVTFSRMQISCHEQITYSLNFLAIGHMIIASENIFSPTIFLYGRFALLIKRQNDAIGRARGNRLLYCKFFLSNSLSGEYCQRLLCFNLAPDSVRICLIFSILMESTIL